MALNAQQKSGPNSSNARWTVREEMLMERLAKAHAGLKLLRGPDSDNANATALVDVQSEEGHGSCSRFLAALETISDSLGAQIAPRSYRMTFSVNYRALFPGNARHYRADILEEFSAEHRSSIWVNGEFFQLSEEVLTCGKRLQRALANVTRLLEKWQLHTIARQSLQDFSADIPACKFSNLPKNGPNAQTTANSNSNSNSNRSLASSNKITNSSNNSSKSGGAGAGPGHGSIDFSSFDFESYISCPTKTEFMDALEEFDRAWASLEERYITNLIAIEDRARWLILEAIQAEKRLWVLEDPASSTPWMSYSAANRKVIVDLIKTIAKLNSVANCRRKGRDDLAYDILEGAYTVLRAASKNQDQGGVQVLALDILGCFDSLREYLRKVSHCLERVDPHLCNNVGLVSLLVEWEECWEVSGRYLRDPHLTIALSTVVNEIRDLQVLLPRLKSMCHDFDVEWFMVLPRLTLLTYLREPNSELRFLMRLLMPHCFCETSHPNRPQPQPGMLDLQTGFRRTRRRLDSVLKGQQSGGGGTRSRVKTEAEKEEEQEGRGVRPAMSTRGRDEEEKKVNKEEKKQVSRTVLLEQDGEVDKWQFTSPDFDLGACETSWEVFARRALNSAPVAPGNSTEECRQAIKILEDFTLMLERFSLDLQRHCPEDWNQCSAILVQCLTGTSKYQPNREFQV